MRTNPSDNAFPATDGDSSGLTKREFFAAIEMHALTTANPNSNEFATAVCAVARADALIQELNKGEG